MYLIIDGCQFDIFLNLYRLWDALTIFYYFCLSDEDKRAKLPLVVNVYIRSKLGEASKKSITRRFPKF